jgi:micrococcal nuclease
MRGLAVVIPFFGVLALSVPAAADELTTTQAPSHIGETATVCGVVASANYASRSNRQPTFLNLDRAYPNHIFTVVIWGSDRSKFDAPEVSLMGKRLCAKGSIKEYKGKPEIVASDPSQLTVK